MTAARIDLPPLSHVQEGPPLGMLEDRQALSLPVMTDFKRAGIALAANLFDYYSPEALGN
jgi:hypothetical protein